MDAFLELKKLLYQTNRDYDEAFEETVDEQLFLERRARKAGVHNISTPYPWTRKTGIDKVHSALTPFPAANTLARIKRFDLAKQNIKGLTDKLTILFHEKEDENVPRKKAKIASRIRQTREQLARWQKTPTLDNAQKILLELHFEFVQKFQVTYDTIAENNQKRLVFQCSFGLYCSEVERSARRLNIYDATLQQELEDLRSKMMKTSEFQLSRIIEYRQTALLKESLIPR